MLYLGFVRHAMIGRLFTMPARYWLNYLSVIIFLKYKNNTKTKSNPDIFATLETIRLYGHPKIDL